MCNGALLKKGTKDAETGLAAHINTETPKRQPHRRPRIQRQREKIKVKFEGAVAIVRMDAGFRHGRYDELLLDPHQSQATLPMPHETRMSLLKPPGSTGGGLWLEGDDAKTHQQWIAVVVQLGTAVIRIFEESARAAPFPHHSMDSAQRSTRPRIVQFQKEKAAAVGIAIRGGSEIGLPIVISKVHPVGPAAACSDLVMTFLYIFRPPSLSAPPFFCFPFCFSKCACADVTCVQCCNAADCTTCCPNRQWVM